MPKKLLLSLAAAAAAFTLAACGADGEEEGGGQAAQSQEQGQGGQQSMPEPDLENIPDVVAEVDGEEISGDEFSQSYEAQFQQLSMQSQMTGEEPDQDEIKQQSLEMMINSELLVNEAEEQDFTASDEDVDEYLSTMAEENQLESSDELVKQFEEQGLDEERVREDVRKEVLMDQVVETVDVDEPSEDEVKELYDTQVEQLEAMNEQMEDGQQQEVPSFEELKPDLEKQAVQQKENEAVSAHLEELREDAEIETHI